MLVQLPPSSVYDVAPPQGGDLAGGGLCPLAKCAAPELSDRPWYHGTLSRVEDAARLAGSPARTFLVRDSSAAGSFVVAVSRGVAAGGEPIRIKVDKVQGGYTFGSSPQVFATIDALLQEQISVTGNLAEVLKRP